MQAAPAQPTEAQLLEAENRWMRAAMADSLEEAEALKAAEPPVRELPDLELLERFKASNILEEVQLTPNPPPIAWVDRTSCRSGGGAGQLPLRTGELLTHGGRERERFTSSPTFLCGNTPATLG